jgi:Putative beta-barrel porin-2, OmpL-like. bbp2
LNIRRGVFLLFIMIAVLTLSVAGQDQPPAQSPPASTPQTAPSTPQPLPNPTMTAPLQTAAPPHTFTAGPFGTVAITGILSGLGLTQSNWFRVPTPDESTQWDVSNAQIFLQKTSGWFQFYLQGGAYNLPDLGVPFIKTTDTLPQFYGPLPVAYLKLVKGNFNVEVGELPTLIGAEYTFSFENMNIERGILWNQENAVSRGIQVSDTFKKLSLSVSWNDGFYSNVYNWITGTAAYAFNSSNTLSFVGGGNVGKTTYSSIATPFLQNNGQIYNIMYTYSHESWTVTPYWQYTHVPANTSVGIRESGSTNGGALLLNYNFKHGISFALRPEYISSNGRATDPFALNLLGYGAGSNAFAFTVTPTYQKAGFFLRGDVSVVDARSFTPGSVFGLLGQKGTQTRGVVEAGFLF